MTLLVCTTIAVAVLYPQSFISTGSYLGNKWIDPLALIAFLMGGAVVTYLVIHRKDIQAGYVDAAVLAFAMLLVVQDITGPSALVTVKYVVLGLGTYYLTTLLVVRGERFSRTILLTIVGLTLVTAAYGLIEYFLQENMIFTELIRESVPDPSGGIHRIGSTLAHPVPFGVYLLQVLPFCALFLFVSHSSWQRVLAWSAMATGALALFFSYSKGSWLVAAVLAGLALIFILRTRNKKAILPALMIVAIVIGATAIFWQKIVVEIDERSYSSVNGREVAWSGALEGIQEHPFGVGLFQGSSELINHIDPDWYHAWGQLLAVDNYYLSLLLEAGVTGFVVWIGMSVLIFREGIVAARIPGPSQSWVLVALAGIGAIYLNSVTVDAFLIWPNYIIFWMTAGMLHGFSWRSKRVEQPSES
ncbi:MAG: O-antigen ligase family protein [Thermoleophilia bacterium]|nr:O-antigen ligase family protein [Thermoleophilia bacterium]